MYATTIAQSTREYSKSAIYDAHTKYVIVMYCISCDVTLTHCLSHIKFIAINYFGYFYFCLILINKLFTKVKMRPFALTAYY